jgi:4-amino-4-deoxy-L-arabinose transferase-like glycosyltransferase
MNVNPPRAFSRVILLTFLLMAVTLIGVSPRDLYGPDEPREAEIAREMLRSGDYAVPHLLGRPFLEKPPLYEATLAVLIKANGVNSRFPPLARLLSVVCGWIILGCVFVIARDAMSQSAAVIAVLLMMQMPAFWKYSHTIVLDIALCAATAVFMTCYYFLERDDLTDQRRRLLIIGAGAALGAALMIKSVVPLAILAPVVIAHAWFFGRKGIFRDLFSPWLLIPALAPILVWAALLYREGGMLYVHEHFLMNLLGRFLGHRFMMAGSEHVRTDLGRYPQWYFYFTKMPEIVGICVMVIPFALFRFARRVRSSADSASRARALFALWAIVPIVLLSFASGKERSYLLPAMPGIALFCAAWIDDFFGARSAAESWTTYLGLPAVVLAAAVVLVLIVGGNPRGASILAVGFIAAGVIAAGVLALRARLFESVGVTCAALIACMMLMYSPGVQRRDQINHTFTNFAPVVWSAVGSGKLYVYMTDETLSPTLAFFGDRDVSATGRRTIVQTLGNDGAYCLIPRRLWPSMETEPGVRDHFVQVFDEQAAPKEAFVLIRSKPGGVPSGDNAR